MLNILPLVQVNICKCQQEELFSHQMCKGEMKRKFRLQISDKIVGPVKEVLLISKLALLAIRSHINMKKKRVVIGL